MAEGLEQAVLELTKTLRATLDFVSLVRNIERSQIQMTEHIQTINREYGETRDAQLSMNVRLDRSREREDEIQRAVTVLQADMDWFKRFFWIVVGAAITGAIGSVISVVLNVLTRIDSF